MDWNRLKNRFSEAKKLDCWWTKYDNENSMKENPQNIIIN